MTNPTPIEWYTVQGVCDQYQISRATLYRWLELGMPSHQPAGHRTARLFDLAEVDEWIRSRCSDPLPATGDLRARQVAALEEEDASRQRYVR